MEEKKRKHSNEWLEKQNQKLKKRIAELEKKQRELRRLLKAKISD